MILAILGQVTVNIPMMSPLIGSVPVARAMRIALQRPILLVLTADGPLLQQGMKVAEEHVGVIIRETLPSRHLEIQLQV